MEEKRTLSIGVIVFDDVMTLDFVGPTSYLEQLPSIDVPVEFVTISNKEGRIQPGNKVALHATTHFKDAPTTFDILVVPGGKGREQLVKDQEFLDYIKTAAEGATYVLSVCTGSYILAAAGLLDNKNATTNKIAYNFVASSFPNVNWVRQARWVVDDKWWTSSGVSAGLDMGYAFISDKYSSKVADEMARYLEIVPNKDPSNDPFVSSIDH
ncbi:hypothetical protein Poli38472_005022 [Pythium oligandrum]|uniref:DJ-1/PfpI domain-containing protein n=1 Tax=Pythium oligandrum TaxID=41045 RepID=A0A8K1FIP0_PYTOL|nr:hypothetical protein Poli38472_005022 [Pythium oligandrum]|eukprot:TMW59953.1 hypothetical protein Poli38472_005022 [Pythium oligandrum]